MQLPLISVLVLAGPPAVFSPGAGGGPELAGAEVPRRVLVDEPRGAHPFSAPNAMVASPDGEITYAGEGASIAILDTRAPGVSGGPAPLIKPRVPFGEVSPVRPVELLPDPLFRAAWNDGRIDERDCLLAACGRDGLWAFQADPDLAAHKAVRLWEDDQRFCNDAAIVRLGPDPQDDTGLFLAALFARKNGSVLRVYCMQDVYAALLDGSERGSEIPPLLEIPLLRHPLELSVPAIQASDSHAFGLDVHHVGGPGTGVADVYVAMGAHGLCRVRLNGGLGCGVAAVPGPGCAVDAQGVEWGPVFGDGTCYTQNPAKSPYLPGNPMLYGAPPTLYGNYGYPQEGVSHPPYFLDVAVQEAQATGNGCWNCFLYVAVDHLAVCGFAIPNGWCPTQPVAFQDGFVVPNAYAKWQLTLSCTPGDLTYTRRVHCLNYGPEGPVLGVASVRTPVLEGLLRSEGRALGHIGQSFNGIDIDSFTPLEGAGPNVFLYGPGTLANLPGGCAGMAQKGPDDVRHNLNLPRVPPPTPVGGRIVKPAQPESVYIAPNAPHPPGGVIFHGSVFRARGFFGPSCPPGGVTVTHERRHDEVAGRVALGVGSSLGNPRVALFGANDGLSADGILGLCPEEGITSVSYLPVADPRGTNGLLWNPRSLWRVDPGDAMPDDEYVWGGATQKWRVTRFRPGVGVCDVVPSVLPDVVRGWTLLPPLDRYDSPGKRNYFQGAVDLEYDADVGMELVFASRSGSPDGVVVLRRDLLVDALEALPMGVTELDLDPIRDQLVVETLVTHPELDSTPTPGDADYADWLTHWNGVGGIGGALLTFPGSLFEVPQEASAWPPRRWILAVPCANVHLDPSSVAGMTWPPAGPYAAGFDRALIRLWRVNNVGNISAQADFEIIGPDAPGAAIAIESFEWRRAIYVAIADFGGRVLVYDVTNLLQLPASEPQLVARWVAPAATNNCLPTNVIDVAVDPRPGAGRVLVYAAVNRVGLQVLEFDPEAGTIDERLTEIERIEASGNPVALDLRVEAGGGKTLFVSVGNAGARWFGEKGGVTGVLPSAR